MSETNANTKAQYDHDFGRVEVVGTTRDGILVEVEADGETYECPVPTGEYLDYGDVEMVYAYEYELLAQIVTDDGSVREAEVSGDGVEDVRAPYEPTESPESIGAEVVYDNRPEDVQESRARQNTDLERYRTEYGDTLYCLPEDYNDSEWAGEDGIEEGATVAFIEFDNDGEKVVCTGEYERKDYTVTNDVGGAFTLGEALEIAENELKGE